MGSTTKDAILRAKYLDWCSARVAERFVQLSPDEIYQLTERATRGPADTAYPVASLSPSYPESPAEFRAVVARVTEVLADELVLPTFEEWAAAYSEAPEEFDSDMLGFWKEEDGAQ